MSLNEDNTTSTEGVATLGRDSGTSKKQLTLTNSAGTATTIDVPDVVEIGFAYGLPLVKVVRTSLAQLHFNKKA